RKSFLLDFFFAVGSFVFLKFLFCLYFSNAIKLFRTKQQIFFLTYVSFLFFSSRYPALLNFFSEVSSYQLLLQVLVLYLLLSAFSLWLYLQLFFSNRQRMCLYIFQD